MALSDDLRKRVVEAVTDGGMSRNAAAKRFGVSIASAVRWLHRFAATGEISPAPTGGDRRSNRIEAHRDYLLGLIRRQPDMTLFAAWFIDDDYNEESFFVRQPYFVGQDPYELLKRALKAEIDEAAWEEMNSTVSRPFPKPASGRICVKVINHFGDEVQKVFRV